MTLQELYAQIPPSRHPEVVVQGDRVFFDGTEYLLGPGGTLVPILSLKALEARVARLEQYLGLA